ncbi:hypothetical protein BBD42_28880 [Paenibacillus sp. BIHB 4019]|uniref:Uncharacterized protein n=1 Tax=Paenibacillus sp. BIHB 4019 TaxID=1870819 RepID=A0A1B2DQU0_9BACL|nr:hypothetical protein BBD42_28880 [Paenibacillus sp. BIHB 4019]
MEAIHSNYLLLDKEFDESSNGQKDDRIPDVDKTPAEIIASQLGWLGLVMGWDRAEQAGAVSLCHLQITNGTSSVACTNLFTRGTVPIPCLSLEIYSGKRSSAGWNELTH